MYETDSKMITKQAKKEPQELIYVILYLGNNYF